MAVELYPAVRHSYGSADEPGLPFAAARAAESVQAFDAVYLTRLPRAILSRGHVVTGDGTIVSWGAPGLMAWRRQKQPNELAGTYLDLTGYWSEGYAHWVLDFLPRLMALELLDRTSTRILVSEPFPSWKAESLSSAGIDHAMVTVIGDEATRVDTLYLAGPIGSPAHCHPIAADWLRATYLGGRPTAPPTRRLYITRRKAPSRRLLNEAELLSVLESMAFEVIDAESLSFDEQVEIYQQASVVVAPHGAGLANLVFCSQATAVVELRAPDYPQFSYEWLSSHCGLRYRSVVGEAGSLRPSLLPIGKEDFAVDPAKVIHRLAELGVHG
jgi:hypothetical protein